MEQPGIVTPSKVHWSSRIAQRLVKKRPKIYVIPTWYCALFNLFLLGLFVVGFLTRNATIIGMGFTIAFIELLSMIEAHVNLRDIEINVLPMSPIPAEDSAILPLSVRSSSDSFGVCVYALDSIPKQQSSVLFGRLATGGPHLRHEAAVALFFWKPDSPFKPADEVTLHEQPVFLSLDFRVAKRGVYEIPEVVVVSMFPFGMFRAVRRFSLAGAFAVYPKPIAFARGLDQDAEKRGESSSGSVENLGVALDYLQHREFLKGDSLRRLDWKASSRRGIKIVKVFSGTVSTEKRTLRWSDTASKDGELKLQELSRWVHDAHHDGVQFALDIPGSKIKFGAGEHHKNDCLLLLAAFDLRKVRLDARQQRWL